MSVIKMLFLVVTLLLVSFCISSSSSNKCCETIRIELGKEAMDQQGITVGLYTANRSYLMMSNERIFYTKYNSNLMIVYVPINSEFKKNRGKWVVGTFKSVCLRTIEPIPSVHCPSEATGWQYWNRGWWVTDQSLNITCLPETKTIATVLSNENTTSVLRNATTEDLQSITRNVIIGSSVGGGLAFLAVIVCCMFCLFKRRRAHIESDNNVDKNPVYMYDYADPDEDNEIYDTNAYYGVTDVDTEGSTVATDLNPDYE